MTDLKPEQTKDREAFEEWAIETGFSRAQIDDRTMEVQAAWEAWQAALAHERKGN